jgi:U3 small nucleolar RNA-associated protein 23
MVELYKLGKSDQETIDIAKAWERRKCNHREAIPGDECVASVVGQELFLLLSKRK